MTPIVKWLLGIVALNSVGNGVAVSPSPEIDGLFNQDVEFITRDVCIIGGGSTGTYAAIRLKDSGKSVAVVEKEEQLGGHTKTYVDPTTNTTVDYSVIIFHDIDVVKDYFDRLGVQYRKATLGGPGETYYANIKTGRVLDDYIPPDPTAALETYREILLNYPELGRGFYLPTPIPKDLVLPFGEFVDKYDLKNAVQTIAGITQGIGILNEKTTLYVMKLFGLSILQSIQSGFLESASQNNHEIYERARDILGSDVLIQSRVIHMSRNASDSVLVTVQSPSGIKVIQASKLLITIPPKLENLNGFDLDETERSLFGQFLNTGYYASLLQNTGLSENTGNVVNIDPNGPYDLPELPGIYTISKTAVPGLFDVKYGSPLGIPDKEVKTDIIASLQRLQIPDSTVEDPEFVAYTAHDPFELTVSVEAIESGFYEDLYGLQGHRNTFYTGAAFHVHDSSLLWEFTEALLPQLGVETDKSSDNN